MCALMPAGAGFPGVADTGVDEFIIRFRRESPFRLFLGLVLGTIVFTTFPLFTIGIPLPSFMLGARLRDLYARKICSHPVYLVRQSVFLVKVVAGMCWGSSDVVRARLALPPYPPDPGTWREA